MATPVAQQPNNNAKQPNVVVSGGVVPQPQPARPNNKSHKKSELNAKGATKEGSDMDVFQDNVAAAGQEVNANVPTQQQSAVEAAVIATNVPTTNDILNANSYTNNNNKNLVDNVQQQQAEKEISNEAATTINKNVISGANAAVEAPKVKMPVDITDIVKDFPKVTKPIQQQPPRQFENQDETDRICAINTEKLVQVKNEANAKGNVNSSETIESIKSQSAKPNLPYAEGERDEGEFGLFINVFCVFF